MSHKIHRIIDKIKLTEKHHYLALLPSLMVFVLLSINTIQSITNTDIIKNNIAIAQQTNQTTATSTAAGFDSEKNTTTNEGKNSSLTSPSVSSIPNATTGEENHALSSYREAFVPNRQITLVTEDAEIDIAPGKRVKAWTFNGTVPGPTIRLAENENVTIKYINKSPIPHTIHFHGNHDDLNDGVVPQVMPNQTYLYNITGEPAGALMYHCHAPPTSLHIRMGMYGALIVDPKDKPLPPAKEFVMVMGEYSLKDQLGLEADYYIINGYADQYMHNPLQINHGDLMRLYVVNLGTSIPVSFHLHSTTFFAYPSGLWDNDPIYAQTVSVAPGDASIIEAKWKYPGTFLFHSHGLQEEKGNMGQINIVNGGVKSESKTAGGGVNADGESSTVSSNSQTTNGSSRSSYLPLTKSVSMFDWQYELQKKLQKPQIINYSQGDGAEGNNTTGKERNNNETSETKHMQKQGESLSLSADKNMLTNITDTNNTDVTLMNSAVNQQWKGENKNGEPISIVPGSSSPSSKIFYEPTDAEVKLGTEVTWINNDENMPHTVTSGSSGTGPSGVFDSGIMTGDGSSSFKHTFDKKGEFQYYCTLHPWMVAKVTVA